jgi:hypothetical protein
MDGCSSKFEQCLQAQKNPIKCQNNFGQCTAACFRESCN